MARFRLRFLLQELELTGPAITMGRGSACQITLDDPLVSRMHAQITLSDTGAQVRDLGSRNGVRVNGRLIEGEAALAHNDRLRLGSQDLVFLVVGEEGSFGRAPRPTGAIAHCRYCSRPFPGESGACPHCGGPLLPLSEGTEAITDLSLTPPPSWTFRLIGEVIERALANGRGPEAERMLRRAARELDTAVEPGMRIGREQVSEAARYALRVACLTQKAEWAEWCVRLHRREHLLPESDVLDLLESLDLASLHAVRPELEALLIDREALGAASEAEDHERERRLMMLVTHTAV